MQLYNLNPFIEPLVSDLNRLYQGIYVNSPTGRIKIRAILSCITCNLPATRKVCGFYNFNALKGCSKCLKSFPTASFGSNIFQVITVMNGQYEICQYIYRRLQKQGMPELPLNVVFDIVRYHMHVVDPMHNLFLGLAKHTIQCNGVILLC